MFSIFRSKFALALTVLVFALLLIITLGAINSTAEGTGVKNLKDCNGTYSGTYKNVTVQEGATCRLTKNATVLGGVHAKKGAANLYVHTEVGRNIQAVGVTGTVHIGPKSCKYDPPVGNNVMVKKSHNVLICWVAADNNIMVIGNDGQITVRDSSAGNNIHVNRNLQFVKDGKQSHHDPGDIRVLRNTAGGHIFLFHNDESRRLRLGKHNSPEPVVKQNATDPNPR